MNTCPCEYIIIYILSISVTNGSRAICQKGMEVGWEAGLRGRGQKLTQYSKAVIFQYKIK